MWKKVKNFIFIIGALLLFIVAIEFPNIANASDTINEAKNPITVKVGYSDFDVFNNGKEKIKRGYIFDYLKALQVYGDFKFEFVKGNKLELINLLDAKKIDLVFYVNKEEAKKNNLVLTSLPITNLMGNLYALHDSKLSYDDFASFNGIKVGVITESTEDAAFDSYAKKHNLSFNKIMFSSVKNIKEALENKKIDACVIRSGVLNSNYKLIGKDIIPVEYIASYKNNKAIKEIELAMRDLNYHEPKLQGDLYKKYFKTRSVINLNQAEEELVQKNKELVVGFVENKRPLMYQVDGQPRGILAEMLNKISEIAGIKIRYKIYGENVLAKTILKDKDIDFIMGTDLFQTPEDLKKSSKRFYDDAFIYVLKEGRKISPDGKIKIGMIEYHKNNKDVFTSLWDNGSFVYYNNLEGVLKAVKDEKADVGILTRARGQYILQSPYNEGLSLSNVAAEECGFVLYPANENSAQYIPIFNKAIDVFNKNGDSKALLANLKAEPYELSWFEFCYKYYLSIGLSLLILLLLTGLYYRAKRKNIVLSDANEKAKAATIAKSEFLANMSHELRTPLNAIIGLNYLLKDSLKQPEVAEDYVAKIDQSSKILLSIINDILDMSAIESGKLVLAKKVFNIKESIYSLTSLYYQQCKNKGIKYESITNNIKYEVFIGDSYRLRQIVLNLLSNAIKFTNPGGTVSLKLSETEINDKKIFLKIEVSDTGCGMSDDMQKRLFGKFEQEDSTTVREHGGSGLGLSISKSLIELMNGEIFVSSKLGVGSKFTVEIPLEVVKTPSLKASFDISKLEALVVDDNKEACKYIVSILKSWKMDGEYTTSPIKAIEMTKKRILDDNEYNLFIVDMRMPEMNGFELVRNLRAIIKADAIIIVISGYDISEFKMEVEKTGSENFLRKPIFPSELFNTLIARLGAKDSIESSNEETKVVNLKGMRILLTEDDPINQLIAKKLLEMAGVIVTVADNGEYAVEAIKKDSTKFDLILMDIQMPVMDGYTATRKIRQLDSEYAKKIPIYALSANSFQKDIDKSFDSGMNGHISKPIDPDNLFKILEKNYKKEQIQ